MGTTGRNWMLGFALTAGLLGTGLAASAAQEYREHRDRDRHYDRDDRRYEQRYDNRNEYYGGGTVQSYIPPSPGEGFTWVAGYYNGGYWVPGSWVFRGYPSYRAYGYPTQNYGGEQRVDRDRAYRDRDRDYRDGGRGYQSGREYRGNENHDRR